MEHIISFLENDKMNRAPFRIELTGITFPDPNYSIQRKNSNLYCLEYVMDGEGTVQVDDVTIHPSKGDIYILPKGHSHYYYATKDNPFTKIWMNVRGSLCDSLFQLYKLEGILLVKDLNLLNLFEAFLHTCEQKDLPQEEIFRKCSLIFHDILSSISMHVRIQEAPPPSLPYELKSYIEKHIYNKITMKELSEYAYISPSQVTRIFRQEFHQTPYNYILDQKLKTAKLLLTNTSMSVKEIAFKLNFTDEHYFSNLFLQKTGIRPSKLRGR